MNHIHLSLILTFCLFVTACKPSGDSSLDSLVGGGGGTNSINALEITSRIPDAGSVRVEIGDTQDFFVSGVAKFPRTVSYSWTLNGTPVVAVNDFSFTAQASQVGTQNLVVRLTDGRATLSNSWEIIVNGPPVVSAVTTGTLQVAVGATLQLQANASDPNNDPLTFEWLINGAQSQYLVGTGATAVLTGHQTNVGEHLITLRVSDGTRSASVNWTIEVNWFPQACNQLQPGQICTFGGSPSKGSGTDPTSSPIPLRFRPIGFAQDAQGSFFLSDLDSNVIWFWNRTNSPVQRIGRTIPARTIQVVAGTGDPTSGSAGISALESPLNSPRGLWYDDTGDRLFIAEWGGSRVKVINSVGIVFNGMGEGSSNTDGDPAFSHTCANPAGLSFFNGSLYVACRGNHRIKRWQLDTDQAFLVAGNGANNFNNNQVAPLSGGIGQAYGVFVNEDGIYITSPNFHRVRFVNTSSDPVTFWAGTASATTVNPGLIATIIGTGGNGASTNVNTAPLALQINSPMDIYVRDREEVFVAAQGSSHLVVANNSPASLTIGSLTVNPRNAARFNSATAGYNGSTVGVTDVRFNSPYALAFDRIDSDRLIIADYNNFRMRDVMVPSGSVSDFLGSGFGGAGTIGDQASPLPEDPLVHLFNQPTGLAFDNSNRTLFIADQNNHRVRQIDRFGVTRTAVGSGTSGQPTVDDISPTSTLIQSTHNATNSAMTSVDLLPNGSLLQVNSSGHNIRIWNRSGAGDTFFEQYISQNRISTVAGNYVLGAGNTTGVALEARINTPNAARFYNNNGQLEIFIVDTLNHCLRRVTSDGTLSNTLGTCGTSGNPGTSVPEASALFLRPRDIAFDSVGNIFIADSGNHHIWYWNRTSSSRAVGSVTVPANHVARIACQLGATGSTTENLLVIAARCNEPTGLAIFNNNLCYSQRSRHNVRCFNLNDGLVSTVAGALEQSPQAGTPFDFSAEGLSGTAVRLQNPSGLAFDDQGNLYIGDTSNHIIKKLRLYSPTP